MVLHVFVLIFFIRVKILIFSFFFKKTLSGLIEIALEIIFLAKKEPTNNQETSLNGFMLVGPILSIILVLLVLVT